MMARPNVGLAPSDFKAVDLRVFTDIENTTGILKTEVAHLARFKNVHGDRKRGGGCEVTLRDLKL